MTNNEPDKTAFDSSLLSATAEEAVDALQRAGDRAAHLIDAWKAQPNAAALAEAAERAPGNLRKLARRALSILKSRGVAIPAKVRVSSLQVAPVDTKVEAFVLPPDAAGGIVVVLASRTPTRRYRSAFVYLHDQMGIRRVEVGEQSQSQLREAMSRLVPGGAVKPVSVAVDWVRYRVAKARAQHQVHGIPQPLGLTTATSLLEPVPTDAPAHPLDAHRLEPTAEDIGAARTDSSGLHRLPEFRAWLPSKEAVDQLLAHVGEGIIPGEEPTQEQLSKLVEAATIAMTDRFFAPQVRESLVTTMKDAALSVLSREGRASAMQVVAAMQAISECGLITNPPHEVGFLRGFFEKAVAVLLAQGQGSLRIPVRRAAPPAAPPAPEGEEAAPPTEVSYMSSK
ncbi:MAG: hypothetical protein ACM3ZE_26485 [Myxococcales bacterium]